MLQVQVGSGREVAEGLEHRPLEAKLAGRAEELIHQPPTEAPAAQVRVEDEEPDAGDAVALVGQREAACVPAAALGDPDRLVLTGEAPERGAGHRGRHVRLEARVDSVLARVGAAMVLDDRSEVPGAELAPNRDGIHGLDSPGLQNLCNTLLSTD